MPKRLTKFSRKTITIIWWEANWHYGPKALKIWTSPIIKCWRIQNNQDTWGRTLWNNKTSRKRWGVIRNENIQKEIDTLISWVNKKRGIDCTIAKRWQLRQISRLCRKCILEKEKWLNQINKLHSDGVSWRCVVDWFL